MRCSAPVFSRRRISTTVVVHFCQAERFFAALRLRMTQLGIFAVNNV